MSSSMSFTLSSPHLTSFTPSNFPSRITAARPSSSSWVVSKFTVRSQEQSNSQSGGTDQPKVWRRRQLATKKYMKYSWAESWRVALSDERDRMWTINPIRGRDLVKADFEDLTRSENRFKLVNEIGAAAEELYKQNPDDYGTYKSAISHAISNRLHESGIERDEAYLDPFTLALIELREG